MKNLKYALIIALIVLSGVVIYQRHQSLVKSQVIALYEHNSMVAQDTIKYLKMKNGQLVAERGAYILSEERMSAELSTTREEMMELRKKLKASIDLLAEIQSHVHVDTLTIPGEVIYITPDSTRTTFSYSDKWVNMNGLVSITNHPTPSVATTLYNMSMSLPLTIGLTNDRRLFATSPNPYVHITDIQSVISDKTIPKKKHWGIGINVGPGLYYDVINKNIGAGIGVQLGVNYNF